MTSKKDPSSPDWEALREELEKPLPPALVKPMPQGKRGRGYLAGFDVIDTANRIFGHGGWSYHILRLECVYQGDRKTRNGVKPATSYIATVRVAVGETIKEDVGAGHDYGDDIGLAHEGAIKEAITDALKRALRTFGYPLGLAMYDEDLKHVRDSAPPAVVKRFEEVRHNLSTVSDFEELKSFYAGVEEEVREWAKNGWGDLARTIVDMKDEKKRALAPQG